MALYTRPDSPWIWYWLDGTSIRRSTGIPKTSSSAAQTKELWRQAQAIYDVRKVEHAKAAAGLIVIRPVIGFAAFADWFATHIVAHHRGGEKEASSLRQLRIYFEGFASLADIDTDVVKEWMSWRKQQVQPSTVNRELDVLKLLLKAAVSKYLEASPIAGLRRFRIVETEPRVLTRDEEARLLAIGGPPDRALVILAIDSLLRLSNVIGLKWAQVKFREGVIKPLNAKVSHDIVPMSSRLEMALSCLPDGEYVFPAFHRAGKGPTAAKNKAIRRFAHLCVLAGITHTRAAAGITFHCLRHTGATRALQGGASVRTVMKLGGWHDERSVMRYVHAADSDVRAAAESISQPARSFHLVRPDGVQP